MESPHNYERCLKCGLGRHSRSRVKGSCRECGGLEFRVMDPREGQRNELHRARKARVFWCHQLVAAMVRLGMLAALDGRVKCVDCGAVARVYEHRDYYRPMEVEPVCDRCNTRRGPGQTLPPEKR